MRVVWRPRAVSDIRAIHRFIATSRPAAAERMFDRLLERAASLGAMPDRGRVVPEHNRANVRETIVGRYRIWYVVTAASDTVEIARVFDARRSAPDRIGETVAPYRTSAGGATRLLKELSDRVEALKRKSEQTRTEIIEGLLKAGLDVRR